MKITIPWRSMSVLVVVGAAMGLSFNALRPDPLPWVAQGKATVKLEDLATPVPGDAPAHAAQETVAAGDPASDASSSEAPSRRVPAADPVPPPADPPVSPPVEPGAKAEPQAEKELYPDIPEADLPITVPMEKAKDFYDRGGLLILDARDMEEYGEGHIRGAETASYDDKVGDSDWMEKTAGDPRPILVYCTGGECELSHDLAIELCRLGHKRVMILTEGYEDWKSAGYPTATGEAR